MIVVHHLENSRSQRVLWMLEELGVDYAIKHYPRDAKTDLAPPELRAVHPLGKSPVITDEGLTLAESGAILEYLVERYGDGRFMPMPGKPEALQYRYWMHYAEGSLMPLMVMSLIFSRIERAPWPVRPVAKLIVAQVRKTYLGPTTDAHLDYVDQTLAMQPWFAGAQFTAADVQMTLPLQASLLRAGGGSRPNIRAFLQRVEGRPAYQRALERGGPMKPLT